MKSLIECIRDYIMEYPGLKDGLFCVDYLSDTATEYCVEAVPCNPVYQRFTDGGCMKQFLFIFASREWYSADVTQNTENLTFYEDFAKWIRAQNQAGSLPDLDGREPVSVEVLTGGYAFDADSNTARYQMQLRLIYHEEEDYL